jgi:hypothetical protein
MQRASLTRRSCHMTRKPYAETAAGSVVDRFATEPRVETFARPVEPAVFPTLPVAGVALIVGVDRFMFEARAMTSMMSNVVASIVVSNSKKAVDRETLQAEFITGYRQTEEVLEHWEAGDAEALPYADGSRRRPGRSRLRCG